jgi:hypothetical protein
VLYLKNYPTYSASFILQLLSSASRRGEEITANSQSPLGIQLLGESNPRESSQASFVSFVLGLVVSQVDVWAIEDFFLFISLKF